MCLHMNMRIEGKVSIGSLLQAAEVIADPQSVRAGSRHQTKGLQFYKLLMEEAASGAALPGLGSEYGDVYDVKGSEEEGDGWLNNRRRPAPVTRLMTIQIVPQITILSRPPTTLRI